MAKNLILYSFSGYNEAQRNQIDQIAPRLEDGAVVLLEDAVIGSTQKNSPYQTLLNAKIPVYCITEDLEARGSTIQQLDPRITTLSYGGLIDLIAQSIRIISWM